MSKFIESLESRSLMSATLTPTQQADKAAIDNEKAILTQLVTDRVATLRADLLAVANTRRSQLLTLRDDAVQIRADRGNRAA